MKYRKEEIEVINNALKLQAFLKSDAAFEDSNGFSTKPSSHSNFDDYISKIGSYRKEN